MDSLMKNQTWNLVELPESKRVLHNKWVQWLKENDGIKRYKARMIVKEFQRREGIDFNDIFSPVVKLTTIRSVMSNVAAKDLHLEQLDVKTVFFHNDLEDIDMMQPKGYIMSRKELLVCKLKECL